MKHVEIREIGQNKGKSRVWLQGEMLASSGFQPQARYEIRHENGSIVLAKSDRGYRNVSAKPQRNRTLPCIDLNSDKVLGAFAGLDHVKVIYREGEIEICPIASELRARERRERAEARMKAGQPLTVGSMAHGGGVLDLALHTGFEEEGVTCELAYANEIRNDLINQSMTVNPVWTTKTIALNGPLQELAFDEAVVRQLPQVDLIWAGLPCSGASVAGRAKRGLAHPEAHPLVGHLTLAFLALVMRTNPVAIVLEQVVPFASSASMDIIRNQLRDMQYDVHETVVDGAEWNAIEARKRFVMVAVTKGMSFNFDDLVRPAKIRRTVAEILEPIALDDPRWSPMVGLKAKEVRDKEAGKSFAMQIFDADSEKLCTLTKGLAKNRSTDAKLRHPEDPNLLRIPTPREHARAKDVPEVLIDGLSDTLSHELLGQSINFKPFVSVGRLVAKTFKAMLNSPAPTPANDYDDLPLFRLVA